MTDQNPHTDRSTASAETSTSGASEILGQLWRYALTGGLATVVNIAIYWCLRDALGWAANAAWLIGYLGAVVTGYSIHSRWSFRGYGRERSLVRTGGKFFLASLVSLGINSFWVWLLVEKAGWPTWAPIPLVIVVTPLAVFAINRRWVFR